MTCRRFVTLATLAAALDATALAGLAESIPESAKKAPSLSEWRSSLDSAFPYAPTPNAKTEPGPTPEPAPFKADPDVAALPAFIVTDSRAAFIGPSQAMEASLA